MRNLQKLMPLFLLFHFYLIAVADKGLHSYEFGMNRNNRITSSKKEAINNFLADTTKKKLSKKKESSIEILVGKDDGQEMIKTFPDIELDGLIGIDAWRKEVAARELAKRKKAEEKAWKEAKERAEKEKAAKEKAAKEAKAVEIKRSAANEWAIKQKYQPFSTDNEEHKTFQMPVERANKFVEFMNEFISERYHEHPNMKLCNFMKISLRYPGLLNWTNFRELKPIVNENRFEVHNKFNWPNYSKDSNKDLIIRCLYDLTTLALLSGLAQDLTRMARGPPETSTEIKREKLRTDYGRQIFDRIIPSGLNFKKYKESLIKMQEDIHADVRELFDHAEQPVYSRKRPKMDPDQKMATWIEIEKYFPQIHLTGLKTLAEWKKVVVIKLIEKKENEKNTKIVENKKQEKEEAEPKIVESSYKELEKELEQCNELFENKNSNFYRLLGWIQKGDKKRWSECVQALRFGNVERLEKNIAKNKTELEGNQQDRLLQENLKNFSLLLNLTKIKKSCRDVDYKPRDTVHYLCKKGNRLYRIVRLLEDLEEFVNHMNNEEVVRNASKLIRDDQKLVEIEKWIREGKSEESQICHRAIISEKTEELDKRLRELQQKHWEGSSIGQLEEGIRLTGVENIQTILKAKGICERHWIYECKLDKLHENIRKFMSNFKEGSV